LWGGTRSASEGKREQERALNRHSGKQGGMDWTCSQLISVSFEHLGKLSSQGATETVHAAGKRGQQVVFFCGMVTV
jgi:hypothetical protein